MIETGDIVIGSSINKLDDGVEYIKNRLKRACPHNGRTRIYDRGLVNLSTHEIFFDSDDKQQGEVGHLLYSLNQHFNRNEPQDRYYVRLIQGDETHQEEQAKILIMKILSVMSEKFGVLVEKCRFQAHFIQYSPDLAPVTATPDYAHQDGVSLTSVTLLEHKNVQGGNLRFFGLEFRNRRPNTHDDDKLSISLRRAGEFVCWDDQFLTHYLTPVKRHSKDLEGFRLVAIVDLLIEED